MKPGEYCRDMAERCRHGAEKSTPVTPYPPAPPQVDDEGNLTEDVHAK